MRERNKNYHWVEELDYAIEEWTLDGIRLVEVLGRVHLVEMANAAFSAAVQMRRASRLMMRRGTQVLRDRLPGER
jgi:hypothetical protein